MEQVLFNIVNDLGPWYNFVIVIAWVSGAILFILGIKGYRTATDAGSGITVFSTTVMWVVGVAMLNFHSILNVTNYTLFRKESRQALDYDLSQFAGNGLPSEFSSMLWFAYSFVSFIGVIAVLRGMYDMKEAGKPSSQRGVGQAITWMFFGVMALNADLVVFAVAQTLGRGNPELAEVLMRFVPIN